jgi:integrase
MFIKNPTRDKSTENQYYNRAISLMKKAYLESIEKDSKYSENTININHNGERIICLDIKYTCVWAVKHWADNLLHSSWKSYRASLIYMAEIFNDKNKITESDLDKIRELLKKKAGKNKKEIKGRTSSSKKKSFNVKEMKKIDSILKKSDNKWSSALRVWIRAGIITGLRPTEWQDVEYNKELNFVKVKNAKNTNGRSLGEHRRINLSHIDESKVKDVLIHIDISNKMKGNGIWDKYYLGCSNLLKYIVRKEWPYKNKYPTLYSCRHQFSANMKASGCSKKEVAALMGHASDLTAQEHYGKKIFGTKGRKPNVNKKDLSKVKSHEIKPFSFDKKSK